MKRGTRNNKILIGSVILIGAVLITEAFIYKNSAAIPYCTLKDTKIDNGKHTKEETTKYLNCRPILVTLKKGTKEEDAKSLQEELRNQEGVYYLQYFSSKEAANKYRLINKNESILLEMMPPDDQFPQTIDVYVSDPKLKASMIQFAKTNPSVALVN